MTLNLITLLRVVTYLWIGIEFSNLAYLYLMGYKNNKPTPIIKALQTMFLSMSIFFFVLAFLPVVLETDPLAHKLAVSWLPLILIPVGLTTRTFRSESLRKQSMELPDKSIMKKNKENRS